ncbi:anti-repressor SinI family protein [Priestia megaterium]
MTTRKDVKQELPKEWEELVVLAMESNVTKEEFKEFIEKNLPKNKKL